MPPPLTTCSNWTPLFFPSPVFFSLPRIFPPICQTASCIGSAVDTARRERESERDRESFESERVKEGGRVRQNKVYTLIFLYHPHFLTSFTTSLFCQIVSPNLTSCICFITHLRTIWVWLFSLRVLWSDCVPSIIMIRLFKWLNCHFTQCRIVNRCI